MIYSKSRCAWFDPSLKNEYIAAGTWPGDAKAYPYEIYYACTNPPAGKKAAQNENGEPVLVDIPLPTVAELKKSQLAKINAEFNKAMLPIINGIPAIERESWKKQEEQARAYLVNNSVSTPLIDALAETRGVDKAELVSRIIAKADLFATISGQLIGKRQALEDAVNALSDKATADDVDAIKW
ncbi:MAG: hypothetical protein Q7U15_05905 [Methylotenera sp.]|nr:hypothetical protein [Methylotenera sp.]